MNSVKPNMISITDVACKGCLDTLDVETFILVNVFKQPSQHLKSIAKVRASGKNAY